MNSLAQAGRVKSTKGNQMANVKKKWALAKNIITKPSVDKTNGTYPYVSATITRKFSTQADARFHKSIMGLTNLRVVDVINQRVSR